MNARRQAAAAVTVLAVLIPLRVTASSIQRLTIVDAVRQGLEAHPRASEARSLRDAARAEAQLARSPRWPSLSVDGSVIGFQEPMIVAPLHGFDPMEPPVFARTLFQTRWQAGYTLFDGGARGAAVARADAMTQQAAVMTHGTEQEVILAVVTAYLQATTFEELFEAEERRRASLEQERARVQQLYDVGRAARVDLLRADAALSSALASHAAVAQTRTAVFRELSRLLGWPADSIAPGQVAPAVARDGDAFTPDLMVARALSDNPGVQAARHEVAAREAAARTARAARFPTLRLTGGVLTFAGSGVGVTGEWQGGVSLSYPIFAGGSRGARISGATAAADAAQAALKDRELQTTIAVDRLIARIHESQARVNALTSAVTHAEEVARIEQLSLSAGGGVQTDFLRAESELYRSRAELEQARHAELSAVITLASLTGDLSVDWLLQHVETQ